MFDLPLNIGFIVRKLIAELSRDLIDLVPVFDDLNAAEYDDALNIQAWRFMASILCPFIPL